MTRNDLLKTFETEGGISTRTQRRYVYKRCEYIKVDVKFKSVEDKNDFNESANDKIIEISKPFLEYSNED